MQRAEAASAANASEADDTTPEAIVEVRDTGTGIPSELKSLIFDPFFTTKGERGTGLGFPQVLAIVERHGGRIELDSTIGQGTTVRMRFSIVTEQTTIVGDASEAPANANGGRSIRVLVVEDEEQRARMASLVLRQRGHVVTVARSGEQAFDVLAEQAFDLVISDLCLGAGKNGWNVADEVRSRHPGTSFVLVTGWGGGAPAAQDRGRSGRAEIHPDPPARGLLAGQGLNA